MTRVVNIRNDSYDVYIGRAGKGVSGPFGNPYRVQQYGLSALKKFEDYFHARIKADPEFRSVVEGLRGKRLGCFCRPRGGFRGRLRCHGQIIAAYLDGVRPEDVA